MKASTGKESKHIHVIIYINQTGLTGPFESTCTVPSGGAVQERLTMECPPVQDPTWAAALGQTAQQGRNQWPSKLTAHPHSAA